MGKPDVPAQTQERPLILVSLCVATFRRPDGLDRLVRSLARVELSKSQVALELNVVDNDPDGSAEPVCSNLRPEVGFPVNYHIEPRRGIPYARNRSVAMIAPEADFAVFVDDDETVEPDWLEQLLRVQRERDADVVSGPVLPRFLSAPSPWIVKGRFFEHDRHQTGDRIDRAYTNNTLVRVEVLRRMAPQFDERMVLSGGSDKQFFRRVHEAGYRMVWANDAIVYEWVPQSRMSERWILQRAFRYGITTPLIERNVRPGWGPVARTFAIGCYRLCKGLLLLPLTLLFGRHLSLTCLRHICYGVGMLAGLFGMRYGEYRQTHGT